MGLTCYQSSLFKNNPRIRHGFFTKKGGCSSGIYHSLNCGPGSNDDTENIIENRRRVLSFLDPQAEHLCGLYQIHSNRVVLLEYPWSANEQPQADSIVTRQKNIALGILTADCAPVFFADLENGVIAAAHAGWQGALNGIIQNTINVMCEQGAEKSSIKAAIGPCIAQQNYQVGSDFLENFSKKDKNYNCYFIEDSIPGKYLFDLKRFVTDQMVNCSIDSVDRLTNDTYADADTFYSYRRTTHRNEPDYGRQISCIMLSE